MAHGMRPLRVASDKGVDGTSHETAGALMESELGLDEVLDAGVAEETEAPVSEPVENTAVEAATGEDVASPATVEDGKPQEAAKDDGEPKHVPIGVMHGERERRQSAERLADQYRQQVERLTAIVERIQGNTPQAKDAGPKVDPDEEDRFLSDPIGYLQQVEQRAAQAINQQVEQRLQGQWLAQSERLARSRHEDYQEKFDAFLQVLQARPHLQQEVLSAEDPGEYAYSIGAQYLGLGGASSVDDLRAQIRAEVLSELNSQKDVAPKTPPSTAGYAGSRGAAKPSDDYSLETLFPTFS